MKIYADEMAREASAWGAAVQEKVEEIEFIVSELSNAREDGRFVAFRRAAEALEAEAEKLTDLIEEGM